MTKLSRRKFLHLAVGATALPSFSRIAWTQAYPSRPVRMIVPFAPGGPTDVFARLIGQQLSEHFGRQFLVENIAGAGGNIGTGQAARSAHDGYTMLITPNTYVINPTFYNRVPYDAQKDFDPVTLAAGITLGVWVHPSVQAKTLKDLVALIRTNPGKFSCASAGTGTSTHILGEQFRLALGLDFVQIPFSVGGPAIAATVAGHTPMTLTALTPALAHIKEGKLRALGLTKHAQLLPDVPTLAEAGFPEIEGSDWLGVLVPTGTPKELVALLHGAIVRVMTRPDMTDRLAALDFETVASTPEEFATRIKVEIETWGKVIRAANIKPE